jgi:hypothetical protein
MKIIVPSPSEVDRISQENFLNNIDIRIHEKPKPRFVMETKASLYGEYKYWVTDSGGNIESYGHHTNLITDLGLDIAAIEGWDNGSVTIRGAATLTTNTALPTNGDITITGAIAGATSVTANGGFNASESHAITDGGTKLTATYIKNYFFVFTTAVTVSDFNLHRNAIQQPLIREVFRDISNNQASLNINGSVPNPKSLRIEHTLIVKIDYTQSPALGNITMEEYNIGNVLIGSTVYNGYHAFANPLVSHTQNIANLYCQPHTTVNITTFRNVLLNVNTDISNDRLADNAVSWLTTGDTSNTVTLDVYTNGNRFRDRRMTLVESYGNGNAYGFGSAHSTSRYGRKFIFDSAQAPLVKANSHQVRWTNRVSWDRV